MHPKIQERRGAVLSRQVAEVDRDINAVCLSLARRVRLAGALCIGHEEADSLERQFQMSVDYVIRIPATSEEGRIARRALIQKLVELEDYIESLFRTTWAKAELNSRSRRELYTCRQNLDPIKAPNTDN